MVNRGFSFPLAKNTLNVCMVPQTHCFLRMQFWCCNNERLRLYGVLKVLRTCQIKTRSWIFRWQTEISSLDIVLDLHSVNCSLWKFSVKPFSQPKIQNYFSQACFLHWSLKFHEFAILGICYLQQGADAVTLPAVWTSLNVAGCSLYKSLSHVWSGVLGRGDWMLVALSLCLCKATVLSSPRKEPQVEWLVQKMQRELERFIWKQPLNFRIRGSSHY